MLITYPINSLDNGPPEFCWLRARCHAFDGRRLQLEFILNQEAKQTLPAVSLCPGGDAEFDPVGGKTRLGILDRSALGIDIDGDGDQHDGTG